MPPTDDRAEPGARPGPDAGAASASLKDARAAVAGLSRRARRALLLERAVRAFWPVWTVAATFLGLALTGALEALPIWLHAALLGVFALAFVWAAIVSVRRFRPPSDAEARAALDADAPDRPVAALDDDLAVGAQDPATRAVWIRHQKRMAEKAMALRPRRADLRLASRDPLALRLSALVLLAFGALVAATSDGVRLQQALSPGMPSLGAPRLGPSVEAWAAPPAYTGADMIYLTERAGQEVALPAGSTIQLRVYNAEGEPGIEQDVSAVPAAFQPMGEGAHDLRIEAQRAGRLAVSADGSQLAEWRLAVEPDTPPSIAFEGLPGASETYALRFDFTAKDDYGVASAWAVIDLDRTRLDAARGPPPSALTPIEIGLPLPFTGAVKESSETLIEDLTEHPWAGLPVTITLHAEDARGQRGESAPMQAVLPARPFYEPMAKAFVEERRSMAWALDNAREALQRLRAVTAYPEDYFKDNVQPYLVARTAMRRLDYALSDGRVDAEIGSVMDLLWRAALLLEDGDLSNAAERLRRAQDRLSEALKNDASDEEIARLMDELRQAMNEYLQELSRQAMQNLDQLQQQAPGGQQLNSQDLQRMLDEMQQMAESGQREMAQQMLQQLQRMLENLRMSAQAGRQGQQGQGQQTLQQLQDMLDQQQGLADRSFGEMQRRQGQGGQQGQQGQQGGQPGQGGQQGQQGQQGQGRPGGQGGGERFGQGRGGSTPGADMGQLSQEQEALRRLLDDLRGQLPGGLSPEGEQALNDAEESMGAARDALEGDDPGAALDDQVDAMESLREGARQLGEAMRRMAQQGQGQQDGRGSPTGSRRAVDPLGRPTAQDGTLDGSDTHVPGAEALKRAREILEELRRRSGERTRPEVELDYLKRLLDRF